MVRNALNPALALKHHRKFAAELNVLKYFSSKTEGGFFQRSPAQTENFH